MGRAPVAPAALGQPVNKATEPIQAKWLEARDNLREAEDRMLARDGKKVQGESSFRVGDQALLSTRNYKQLRESAAGKLAKPYVGPFLVKRVLSPTVVELDIPSRMDIHSRINTDQLKKFKPGPGAGEPAPQPLNDAEGRPMWLIERILRSRERRGRTEFLIQPYRIAWIARDSMTESTAA